MKTTQKKLLSPLLLVVLASALPLACNSDGSSLATYNPPQPGTVPAAGSGTVQTAQGSQGTFLVDMQGRSLYLFLADTPNMSNCTGACAAAWPPFTVASGQTLAAEGGAEQSLLGQIQRADGTTQVTYKTMPLYYYAGDTAAGQTNGEGLDQFGAQWFLVAPDGSSAQ